jgi:lipopolysaccharide heptosyltransferase III
MARDDAKILVLARPSIGDVLLATPLLRALRRRWPSATLDVLIYSGQEQVLEGNPDIDRVFASGKHPTLAQYRAQRAQMGRRYDLGLSVSASDRSLFYMLVCARERYSVVPVPGVRAPWRDAWKRWICRASLPANVSGRHTLEQNRLLGELAGVEPDFRIVPPRRADSEQTLGAALPALWRRAPFAVLHLTPGHPFKRWHLDGWSALARWLRARGLQVVLTGGDGAEERAYLDAARRVLPGDVHDIAGRLRLADLALLLEHCALYAGPDTVATHLAAGLGTPTIAIFGPSHPLVWAPWPAGHDGPAPPFWKKGTQHVRNVFLVQGPGACVPCQQLGCERHRNSRSDCLDALDAGVVIAAAEALLSAPVASDQASST